MLAVIILILIALLTVGVMLYLKYRQFSGYRVDSSIEMSNSEENTQFYNYGKGYLKCAGDGITYFDSSGIIWGENYSVLQPVVDICGDYIAVADMGQRNIYLYDQSGHAGSINLSHNITDVEVSSSGVVAVASSDGNINYLEVMDKNGNEIMTEKSVFSASGFLMDLSLSDDGTQLAAVMVSVSKGTLKSKVVFYDLSGGAYGNDIKTGTFEQYDSIILTSVRFMSNGIVCVVGDRGWSLYDLKGEAPELIYEDLTFDWEIESLFFQKDYIGMIVQSEESEHRYDIKVFDTEGNIALDQGFDFSYSEVDFAGENVLLYSYDEGVMYSFAGIEKMYITFDKHIEALISSDGRHFAFGSNAMTEFLTLTAS